VATPSRFRGAILVLATVLLAGSTADAQSIFCGLKRCDDGDPCTVDSCRGLGTCVFEPVRCDDGDACTVDRCDQTGTCRFTPGGCDDGNPCTADTCNAGACVSTPLSDGESCADDGFTCTDDACSAGSCLHVPIDSRCVAPGECASAACAPQAPGADVAGCLPGTPLPEGADCAEDGLPCTDDVCRENSCVHASVPDVETCEPVTRAFRLTLVLASQARAIAGNVQRLAPETEPMPARALGKLAQVEATLRDTAAALAGRTPVSTTGRAGGLEPTVGQLRAVAAADRLASVPGHVREALLALRRLAPSSDDELLALTIERARSLRRGVRRLKLELKRLRRVQQTFAP
jgi:slime mold repeat-containing protein